jgi:hypothetical protein
MSKRKEVAIREMKEGEKVGDQGEEGGNGEEV